MAQEPRCYRRFIEVKAFKRLNAFKYPSPIIKNAIFIRVELNFPLSNLP